MADKKISELTSLAQGSIDADADVIAIVDTSATETKKATAEAVVLAALSQASAVTIPGTATINSTTIPNNKTLLVSTDVGSTVQAYDANTAKYDDVTANFTGTLQNSGSNVLVDTDIGTNVQAYDADTAKYDDTTANFTGTLQNGGSNVLVDTDIGVNVQAYDADIAKYDDTTANFTGTLQNNSSNVLVDTDIGVNVQAYDADTAKYDDTTANFTGTLQNGGHTVLTDASDYLDSTDIGVNVLAYDSNLQAFVNAVTLPESDGSADQVLVTNGAGVISWADQSGGGGGGIVYSVKTTTYTASAGEGIIADTSGGSWTLTLPATPTTGDVVVVADGDDWATNNLTVARNGSTIEGVAENLVFDVGGTEVQFLFDGTTWQVFTKIGFTNPVPFAPSGSDTQIQYNSGGSFAGASGLVTDGSNLTLNAQGDLRFADSDSSNWVAFQAPATVASNVTWTLPDADGTDGQVIKTNGSGTLSWVDQSGGGGGGGTSVTVTQATATASQTDFSVTYTVGQLSVYLNGALLASADYTATNGTTVVLAAGAASGDIFTAVAYDSATQITQGDTAVEVSDTGSDGTITFDTDGSEAMRIDASQNVGIGITSPAERLHVSGAGRFSRTTQPTQYIEAEALGGVSYINVANGTSGVYQSLVFNSSNNADTVERMRINATGALVLGGGNTSATGTGIAFPATQSASTDANTLDDYEEGTWTPNQGSGLVITGAYTSSARYVKIGRIVYVEGIQAGATNVASNAGGVLCTNLPFTATTGNISGMGGLTNNNLNVSNTSWVLDGTTTLYGMEALPVSGTLRFSATYQAST